MNSWIEPVATHLQAAHFTALFLDALIKSFVVLALAAGTCTLWRRSSAATRHLIWLLAVAGLPCLPLLTATLPAWQKPLWSVSTTYANGNQVALGLEFAAGNNLAAAAPQTPPAIAEKINAGRESSGGNPKFTAHFGAGWLVLGFAAWVAGVVLVLLSITSGQLRLHRFSRRAQTVDDADWTTLLKEAGETLQLRRAVTLLQSAENLMPLTWGWWRPVVFLPAEADHWPVERRRIVLLHELAHVKRWDCLTQLAANLVGALFWFNPLVWLAAWRMCVERERACDDLVLNSGCKASDYAGHLVDIAQSFRRIPQVAAIAMARPSGLERRVAAIVDASRPRCLRPITLLAVLAVAGGIIFCVNGCQTTVASSRAETFSSLREEQIVRLKEFSVLKEKQSQTLAAAAGETISPEFQRYFDAATQGDWQTVTNMYESFKRRHPQYGKPGQHSDASLRTSYWGPVLEISLAYDHVVRCEPKYTQLAVDGIINSIPAGSIYFGGTDPGRGLPTAFSKSQVRADPFYTLTQNALADGTYLEYLRKTYGEEKEQLTQLAEACRTDAALQAFSAKWSEAVQKLDALEINEDDPQWKAASAAVNEFGQQRQDRVKGLMASVQFRATAQKSAGANQTGAKTIYTPTSEDSQHCFMEYVEDAKQRLQNHQLKPGEDVKVDGGRVQVSGQVAVMAINGRMVKIIFDKNPGHEFFIEESFPLDWMYPYLEPHGLIFKINREPLAEMSDALIQQDRAYWQKIVSGMIGGWLKDDTSVKDVAAYSEKVFVQHDLGGFTGDSRFVQNDYATRMFSKWRSSIAGLYAWRAEHAEAAGERERMAHAADLAFRQAVALCPYSPEADYRYATFLTQQRREADARLMLDLAEQSKHTKASVFQMRRVVDETAADAEKMIMLSTNKTTGRVRQEVLFVEKKALLDQKDLQSAKLTTGPQGDRQVEITFTSAGREKFARVTREHLHQRLAILIDGQLMSVPRIQSEIPSGIAQITGNFSEAEAAALAEKLNAAAGK